MKDSKKVDGVAIGMRTQMECMVPCLREDDEAIESLWIIIKYLTGMNDVLFVYAIA